MLSIKLQNSCGVCDSKRPRASASKHRRAAESDLLDPCSTAHTPGVRPAAHSPHSPVAPALAAPGRAQLYSSRLLARLSVELLAAGAAPGLCAARTPKPGPRRSWALAAAVLASSAGAGWLLVLRRRESDCLKGPGLLKSPMLRHFRSLMVVLLCCGLVDPQATQKEAPFVRQAGRIIRNATSLHTRVGSLHGRAQNVSRGSRLPSAVLGVMMYPGVPVEYRNAVRASLRKYETEENNAPRCTFRCKFWTGEFHHENYTEELRSNLTDLVDSHLPETGNINHGKVFHWFKYAIEHLSGRFDYLIKMDADVAVNWTSLCRGLSGFNKTLDTYFGRSNSLHCGPHAHCPNPNCTNFEGDCWMYMSGGLYGFSWSLGRKIVKHSPARSTPGDGKPEDMQTAKWIKALSRQGMAKVDVVSWDNGVHWCHDFHLTYSHISNNESYAALNCTKEAMNAKRR